ncbi:MAG: alpha/beta fold hydrolase [Burkholderiales bacterium]|nr:alpha/beta fold hydrolase [Burkholderiales bacterium]
MKTALAAALLALALPAFALARDADVAVKLETPTGTLHGSLRAPLGAAKGPVVLLVAGSGPTDRDGNQPRLLNDSLRQLAAALGARGIATLRYDKRGVALSREAGRSEKDLRFDHYVDDAAAWVAWLKADARFSLVAVAGHSEGALVGALAAAKAGAGAFVSIAGIARKPAEILRAQLRPRLPGPFWLESERILARLEHGETADGVPRELDIVYRPSVQPYLISWFRQSPAEAMRALEVPVLVVQGSADVQVPVVEGEALAAAARNAQLFIVPDMSHALKPATDAASSMKGLTDPTVAIVPQVPARIARFVREAALAAPPKGR